MTAISSVSNATVAPAQDAGRTHHISWGDTLSQIARDNGTTVAALMAANPQIKNPDLIYAGDTLVIPSGGGGGGGTGGSAGVSGAGAVSTTGGANGNNAADIARQFIGRNAGELKHSDELPMQSWVPNNVNCANFVSAVLQKAGMIDASQASASVAQLNSNLRGAGWTEVSLQNAQPGDVVVMKNSRQSHVVLFAGFDGNGKPQFIGSNNVNPDGSQRISWGGASGDYRILTPPR
ncbi:LysM peptidoglycan-binding domain-containing protein [Coralloluteibacterium thermophilus]|uniref:LysM peptidoglycan-binding domain-containing protein n=1 Tax=Coralloluteibacterium thermophilum TaxID=2707049 RepID=A0ABV9NRH9_9GAMM